MKKILKWVVIVFVGLIILGALFSEDDTNDLGRGNTSNNSQSTSGSNITNQSDDKEEPKKEDLELIEHSFKEEEYINYVVGTIINNTNKEYNYVQIEVNLLDEDDAIIGSTLDNINNLGPGKKWKFKAMILDDETVKYEIKNITGF